MLQSGCVGLVVGFESLTRENLEQMDKNCNLGFDSYDPLVQRIRAAGLQIWAAFLLGYDSDTARDGAADLRLGAGAEVRRFRPSTS